MVASRLVTLFLLEAIVMEVLLAETDWTLDCNKCKCVWSSGKKFADCKGLNFGEIPKDLSTELREIDFSNNPLYELKRQEFFLSGLQNVHKLKLANCSLLVIDASAFESLKLLIEIDLSYNAIKRLDNSVFRDNAKLRILYLSNNKLQQLGNNMFANMTHLQRIHLGNNQVESISDDIFGSDCTVRHLSLQNNRLTNLSPSFTDNLKKLNSLDLDGNPWVCDCNLEPFRKLTLENTWITTPVECHQPDRLRGRKWSDPSAVFACPPKIIEPSTNAVLEFDSVNYTISCKVEGEPRPTVAWTTSTRTIIETHRNAQKYHMASSKDWPYWENLTIINIKFSDRGDYKCTANNAAGSDERTFSIYLRGTGYVGGDTLSSTTMSNTMLLIIVLAVSAIILLLVIMLLVCCCCKRNARHRATSSKGGGRPISQSSEFISMDGRPGELEKSLLTDVNPVLKPPRQYSAPASVTSGGTEVSEAKKMLIDDESIYNGGDDDAKLYDYVLKGNAKSPNHLDVEYKNENHYPPDLLSFPPRATHQISPAGSSASTVADTTRLPPHHHGLPSPLHSPLYDTSSLYRTLPYSRSHSPFATSNHIPPTRVPRPGAYVTIPRRPRASWSSEPSHNLMPEIGEPLYDNLGLRTTAKGASALSLNKLTDAATTPMPMTPRGARPNHPLSPQPCDTIAEHESSPPTKMIASTLPRNLAAHRDRALSPTLESLRGSWARSSSGNDSRRDSTASLIPSEGKSPKIPPRPPPKPKKRLSTGPLFEDEGEDGTEV